MRLEERPLLESCPLFRPSARGVWRCCQRQRMAVPLRCWWPQHFGSSVSQKSFRVLAGAAVISGIARANARTARCNLAMTERFPNLAEKTRSVIMLAVRSAMATNQANKQKLEPGATACCPLRPTLSQLAPMSEAILRMVFLYWFESHSTSCSGLVMAAALEPSKKEQKGCWACLLPILTAAASLKHHQRSPGAPAGSRRCPETAVCARGTIRSPLDHPTGPRTASSRACFPLPCHGRPSPVCCCSRWTATCSHPSLPASRAGFFKKAYSLQNLLQSKRKTVQHRYQRLLTRQSCLPAALPAVPTVPGHGCERAEAKSRGRKSLSSSWA